MRARMCRRVVWALSCWRPLSYYVDQYLPPSPVICRRIGPSYPVCIASREIDYEADQYTPASMARHRAKALVRRSADALRPAPRPHPRRARDQLGEPDFVHPVSTQALLS